MVADAGMSTIVEYHTCTMKAVIPSSPDQEFLSPWGIYRCTHYNLDGTHCQAMVTGHNMPYFAAGSHVTSSEAITAWLNKDKASGGPEG